MSLDPFSPATNQDGIQLLNPLAVADWDQKVATLPGATFFHGAAWLRVLHHTYGYQPAYLVEGGLQQLNAMLPFLEIDSMLTGRRGVSLPFTDSCEPLCPNQHSFDRLFAAALTHAADRHWKYFECRGGKQWLPNAPVSTGFFNHALDLTPGESKLFANLDEGTRRAVRKARQSNLTVEFSHSLEAMRMFYTLVCQTRRRHGVPPQPFSFFANVHRHVLATGKGWLVMANQGSKAVAGALYLHFGRTAIYKFGASDESFQQLRPNNLVMWEAIRRHTEHGFTSLDFGRTSLGNEGLRRFKLGWGTRESQIGYVRYDRPSGRFTVANDRSSGSHTRFFNFLPVSLSRIIGRLIYRHLG